MSADEPKLLRIHLRGGQTVEKIVTDWGLKKNGIDGLTELRWASDGKERLPFVRLDAVDAVTVHPVPRSTR